MTADKIKIPKQIYAGIFMVSMATLMYEILLTRIFSVTMWYHFAFVAVSVAMFGMTVGAVIVYLLPHYFTPARTRYHLILSSLWFAISIVASFFIHLRIPFNPHGSWKDFCFLSLTYLVISVPFIFSGICICLTLTKFSRHVSKLYAADLAGAAAGCLLLIYTLRVTDGITAVILVAFLASMGTVSFLIHEDHKKLKRVAFIFCLLLALFAAIHTWLVEKQYPLFRLIWVKGKQESRPLYEKWNSFSRIRITGHPSLPSKPKGWGFSYNYLDGYKVPQLNLSIDAHARTVLTFFDGNLKNVEYLKYDITNLAHYLRPEAKVLVAGAGGGRDILSALVFEQKSVVGVEINEDIIDTVNQRFGDFTGHLDKNPRVTFVNEEARSYIARQKDKFDIIQFPLTNTWAATAAGAFVLTENSLYTVEAWKTSLEHLTPHGLLTFSCWYRGDFPVEMYRLTSLASTSLIQLGIENPQNHIIIARNMRKEPPLIGMGTLLVSKRPFSGKDVDIIKEVARQMDFDLIFYPGHSSDFIFERIAGGKNLDLFFKTLPVNIGATTDDNPFFFYTIRAKNIFNPKIRSQGGVSFNTDAVFVLSVFLIITVILTCFCIFVPLIFKTDKAALNGAGPLLIFFASIGFGFMLVEISLLQRLIIFLGHPIYGLSVLLFGLLLSGGLGSFLTQKIDNPHSTKMPILFLFLLLCTLVIFMILTPSIIHQFQGSPTISRILAAIGILLPLGLFMGTAFPVGMKLASSRSDSLTPWLWGINGATSVCASVVAFMISINAGINSTFRTGFIFYLVAFIAFVWAGKAKG